MSVSEIHTHNCLLAPEGHFEPLFFSGLVIFCQPEIGRMFDVRMIELINVLGKYVACRKDAAQCAVTILGTSRALIAAAAQYLLRVTR